MRLTNRGRVVLYIVLGLAALAFGMWSAQWVWIPTN